LLGGQLLGWHTVCAVEIDPYCRQVLLQRQRDGALPEFPIWDDVRTFEGWPWRGAIDVISGGFPCQDISCAGRGEGLAGARSGLWGEFARIIGEVGPRFVFVENSPLLVSRGLDRVLGDLAEMGYDAAWGVLGACHAGAPHRRERIWIVADASERRCAGTRGGEVQQPRRTETFSASEDVADAARSDGSAMSIGESSCACDWWESEPDVGRVVNGVAARVDRLRALGNGQVPAVAALAWRILRDGGELEVVPRRVTRKQILEELLCH
jgi:DNA (cytosine-5)-methyltransferase 1